MLLPQVTLPRRTPCWFLSPSYSCYCPQPVEWTGGVVFLFCPGLRYTFLLFHSFRDSSCPPCDLNILQTSLETHPSSLILTWFLWDRIHLTFDSSHSAFLYELISVPCFKVYCDPTGEWRVTLSPNIHGPWETCPRHAHESRTRMFKHWCA